MTETDQLHPLHVEISQNLAEINNLRARLEQAERERDCYRAVLEGAEYPNLDRLAKQDLAFCSMVGVASAEVTKKIQKERDEARGLLREIDKRHLTRDMAEKVDAHLRGESDD